MVDLTVLRNKIKKHRYWPDKVIIYLFGNATMGVDLMVRSQAKWIRNKYVLIILLNSIKEILTTCIVF